MNDLRAAELNERFGLAEQLTVVAGPGQLPQIMIDNRHARATIALHGGQVLAFQPHGAQPVLWLSREAQYLAGKAIRGGIPVCWPWFGPHPTDAGLPAHGFVRTMPWRLAQTTAGRDGTTVVRLELSDDERTLALWPHSFRLALTVTVGPSLDVDLAVTNGGSAPFTYTGALHSYFTVGDIGAVAVHGLDGTTYVDQLQSNQRFEQQVPVTIGAEVDRIYVDTLATCTIVDERLQRRITVAKDGSRTTVVWNPWVEKARRMADFGDDEFRGMLCVETANAADDRVTVAPGAVQHLRATIGVAEDAAAPRAS